MNKTFSKTTITLLILSLISFAGHLFIYPKLPDQIPIQWSSSGAVNSYGGKYMDLVIAVIPTLVLLLMVYLPKIDPRRANYLKHAHAYNISMIGITLFMILVSWMTALASLGYPMHIQVLVPAGIGIFFIAIGNVMPQVRSNYFFGIKTPWALENETVWRKTHKMGGIWFCILGVVFIIIAFSPGNRFMDIFIPVAAIATVPALYLYSYLAYRQMNKDIKSDDLQ